jgi:putative ABC transport system permease protein
MTSLIPLISFDRAGFHIRDRRAAHDSEDPSADRYSVSPDYFRVMRIPLKRGHLFTEQDSAAAPKIAVISETCAREQFPNQDPIGKQIQLGGRDDAKPWMTIVGIVGDVRQYGVDTASNMAAYIPQAQDLSFGYSLVARTSADPRTQERAVRAAFLAVDPTQPVFEVQSMESYLASSLAQRRFTLVLLALFGGLALAMAAVGIYGVVSCAVAARTREMGIRMALGAQRGDVLAMVLRHAAALTGLGLAAGCGASLALTRLLSTLLFEVRPTDAVTLGSIAVLLAAIALAASYLPARRAASVDPTTALHYE